MLRMLSAVALKDRLLNLGPSCRWASCSWHARRLRHPHCALPQTKLSRKSNQIARARIRRFESDMPSQAVQSLRAMCGFAEIHALARRLRSPSSKAVTNSIHCRGSRNRNRSKSGGARCAHTAASTRSWSSLTVLFGIDRRLFEEFERKHHLKGIKFKLTVK